MFGRRQKRGIGTMVMSPESVRLIERRRDGYVRQWDGSGVAAASAMIWSKEQ